MQLHWHIERCPFNFAHSSRLAAAVMEPGVQLLHHWHLVIGVDAAPPQLMRWRTEAHAPAASVAATRGLHSITHAVVCSRGRCIARL
jgi:hypothetical protein